MPPLIYIGYFEHITLTYGMQMQQIMALVYDVERDPISISIDTYDNALNLLFYTHPLGENLSGADVYMLQTEVLKKGVNAIAGLIYVAVTWTDLNSKQTYEQSFYLNIREEWQYQRGVLDGTINADQTYLTSLYRQGALTEAFSDVAGNIENE